MIHRGNGKAVPLSKARDLRRGRRVLFIEDRIPAPPQGCGFPRSFAILKYLVELGFVVTVLPTLNATPWQPYTQILEKQGVETLYGQGEDWRPFFEERQNGYEIVWVSRHHNFPRFYKTIKASLPEAGLIFDSEALFSLRELEKLHLADTGQPRAREIQLRKGVQEEIRWMKKADIVITVSEREKKIIAAEGVQNIRIWPHAVPLRRPQNTFQQRKDLLFVGGFLAPESPNTAAVLYFVDRLFPALHERLGVRLFIVGSHPPQAIRNLASDRIVVTGFVEELEPFYNQSRIFIVPHLYAGGIPLKLLEAMGSGLPAVVSSVIAEQLGFTQDREVSIAADPEEFILKTEQIYNDENLWTQRQVNSLAYIEAHCSPEALKARLQEIIIAAGEAKLPSAAARAG